MGVYDPHCMDTAKAKIDNLEELIEQAVDEVVAKQLDLGIDVITDGEMERETYFLHFVRQIKGMDTDNLVTKSIRDGNIH